MKKPKPLFAKTSHHYVDREGNRWMTTAKPGSPLQPGARWAKERSYDLELFWGLPDEDPYVIGSCFSQMTPEKAQQISKWFMEVSKYLKHKGPK